ncbi:MAG: hypothetical protein ACRD29_11845 [Acidimicrobiales bacterium]
MRRTARRQAKAKARARAAAEAKVRTPVADRHSWLRWWPRRRLAVVYNVNGPRVRVGVLWFLANLVALAVGLELMTPLWAITAAVAGLQASRAWRKHGTRAHRLVAGVGAGAVAAAAATGAGFMGIAVLAVVGAAYYLALIDLEGGNPVEQAGYTIQCALFAGAAAAGVVSTLRFDVIAATGLLLLVSAYEAGDFLIGSGARWKWEGPAAGMIAALVVAFAISTLRLPPFVLPESLWLAGLVAGLCPIGQLVASAVLPDAGARAPALRRLDSMIVLAPVWALVTGILTAS